MKMGKKWIEPYWKAWKKIHGKPNQSEVKAMCKVVSRVRRMYGDDTLGMWLVFCERSRTAECAVERLIGNFWKCRGEWFDRLLDKRLREKERDVRNGNREGATGWVERWVNSVSGGSTENRGS